LNWASANWSGITDLVKLNNRAIRSLLKVNPRERIVESAKLIEMVLQSWKIHIVLWYQM